MRMDLTLNVTPEGSLCDLPAAVGGTEETREGTQQILDDKRSPSSNVIPSTAETPETQLKVTTERDSTQVESPRRIERTREASREDAIASTGHFMLESTDKMELQQNCLQRLQLMFLEGIHCT